MSRVFRQARRGVVLIWSLVTLTVTTTILGVMGMYYTRVGRISRYYQQQTGVDFAAWRGIDEKVHANFGQNEVELTPDSIVAALMPEADASVHASAGVSDQGGAAQHEVVLSTRVQDGTGLFVQMTAEEAKAKLRSLDAQDENNNKLLFEVISEASLSLGGGIPAVTRRVREVIEVRKMSKGVPGVETLPVFDYVYFANNYGHLDASVVANGDVGANDRFTFDGSRVNGYVNVRGASSNDTGAVVLQNSPKMWPYYTYMKRVVEKVATDAATSMPGYATEGVDFYTSVRPTNPIHVSETSNIVWKGGYEPPGYASQYGEVLSSGSLASIPPNPYTEVLASYSGENTNAALYQTYYDGDTPRTNPLQDEYEDYYDSNGNLIRPSGESTYLKYYAEDGTARPNEYAELYAKYYNTTTGAALPYEHQAELNALAAERNTYFSSDYNYNRYSFKDNPYKNDYEDHWTTDWRGNEKAKKNPYNQKKKPTEWQEWEDAKNAVHPLYHNWENGKAAWQRNGTKRNQYDEYVQAASRWTTDQQAAKRDYDNWNRDKATFDRSSAKREYEQWRVNVIPWKTGGAKLSEYLAWNSNQTNAKDAYDGWNTDKENAISDFRDWQRTFEDWLNNLSSGGEEVDLNWQTAHLSVSNGVMQSQRIISVSTNFLEVPKMSDGPAMQGIIDFCQTNKTATGRIGGYLYCRNRFRPTEGAEFDIAITNVYEYHYEYYRTGFGATEENKEIEPTIHRVATRTLNTVEVPKGDGSTVIPITSSGSAFATTASLETGSAILIGTEAYPIIIDGPVYFKGDVIIRGFVKGQGTIYAGRNIHIIGDITYLNPPNWPHKNLSVPKNHPNATAERNRQCDLLMLVARGNIVVGDYTSDIWQSDANMQYLRRYGETSPVCNEFIETDIGYSTGFNRDYTAEDGGQKVETKYKDNKTSGVGCRYEGHYLPLLAWAKDISELEVKKVNRKYYESLFGEKVIAGLKQTASADPADAWRTSTSIWQRIRQFILNAVEWLITGQVTPQAIINSRTPAAGDITEIDAALVANHGIFGVVGGDGMPQFTLNGLMLCRDEGLLPSFSTRFDGYSQRKVWLNWDLRFKTSSAEGVLLGAPQRLVDNMAQEQYVITVKSRSQIQ